MTPVENALEEQNHTAMPTTLQEWRELILDWVLRGMLVFWLITLIWGVIVAFIFRTPTDSLSVTPILIGIYLISTLITLAVTFLTQLSYKLRATIFLVLLFGYGLLDLFLQGFTGEGTIIFISLCCFGSRFF